MRIINIVANVAPRFYGGEDEKAKDRIIIDNKLLTMFSKAQTLSDEDRKCVKSFLKVFLFQKDMQKQLA